MHGTSDEVQVPGVIASDTVLNMVLQALTRAGGEEYLYTLAMDEPKTFVSLLNKVLPMQESGDVGGPVTINIVKFSDTEPQE